MKINNKEKHLKRYLKITVLFFTIELLLQLAVIKNGWNIKIGETEMPFFLSYVAVFIAVSMIFMGVYYIRK